MMRKGGFKPGDEPVGGHVINKFIDKTFSPVLAAFSAYAVLSAVLLWHGANLRQNILGVDSDPFAFVWCLAWWPFALLHHLDPLHVHLVWQPEGMDLAWMTSVPLLGMLAAPLTLWAGPLLSYNLLTLAAPVLSAAAAYLLCLYLTRRPLAAFCGGLAYGFSTFEMAESLEHLNLDFSPVPALLLLIVLARLDDKLSRWRGAGLFALALAVQFYISLEVAATSLLLGGVAWLLAMALLPARRLELRRLVADGALAALATLPLLGPFLWDMLSTPRGIIIPQGWAFMASAHLGNLFVTTPPIVFYAGSFRLAGQSWLLRLPQSDLTTGLPLLLILAHYFWLRRSEAVARYAGWVLIFILVLSLGPQLWLGGRFTRIVMPWALLLHVPVLSSALPVRFAAPAGVGVGVIIARWVATGPRRLARAAGAGCAVWVTLMPPHPVTPAPFSSFFRPGNVQTAIGPRARILILPCKGTDVSSFWQAEQNFGFAQTGGYLGMPPVARLRFSAVRDLIVNQNAPHLGAEIAVYARATRTQFVLAGPCTAPAVLAQVQALAWPRRQMEDMLVFTVPAFTVPGFTVPEGRP